jgi:hypothetical protein
MKQFLFCFLLFILCIAAKSQNIGIGGDIMYNFQTESFGAGARVSVFPNNRLSFVPQFSYYFAFNKVNEYYLGLGLEYKIIRRKWNIYAIAHGAYNRWINSEESPMINSDPNNWNVEGGLGISNNRCLRPFLEYRYNVKFRETHLRLGILYIFGCKGGSSQGIRSGNRNNNHNRCPAYN